MHALNLYGNKLAGKHFFAHMAQLVYESTAECFVPENVLAGAIPTEIGQLAQLKNLNLQKNQLIGVCTGNSLDYNGIRVNFD